MRLRTIRYTGAMDRDARTAGILFVVATPIGNPEDLSPRALRILAEADRIACEDTRRAGLMLAAHAIRRPMISYFEHNEERRTPEIVARLAAGEKIALITDAGTPAISDPGYRLVRAALEAGIPVRAVPGPSAVVAALSVAGIATNRFAFEGFLPQRDAARHRHLESLAREPRTLVFYEAGRRLGATLAAMAAALGAAREAAIVREITKTYEETIRAPLGDLARRFAATAALGEITIVVAGAREVSPADDSVVESPVTVEMLIAAGLSLAQASGIIARLTGRRRREIYQQAIKSRAAAEKSGE
ncbi:MAG TPA: 16S rRNA (cytidine(1402)-2'-O)-methyltransferase [Candidatus Binataceae bacterium]|nr:16S rRNA (cytidine(1402)-2'-O)-methyltransferase [Candidatus Binataceae bacterium]